MHGMQCDRLNKKKSQSENHTFNSFLSHVTHVFEMFHWSTQSFINYKKNDHGTCLTKIFKTA